LNVKPIKKRVPERKKWESVLPILGGLEKKWERLGVPGKEPKKPQKPWTPGVEKKTPKDPAKKKIVNR